MFDFLLAPENLPFLVALGMMVAIGLLEGATALTGAGLSQFFEGLLPAEVDFDLDLDLDAELDLDLDGVDFAHASHGPLMQALGWLRVGRVPLLILLVIFLFGFGCMGLVVQSFAAATLGGLLPVWLASAVALGGAVPVVHVLGGLLARVIPRDETEAVSERKFIGRIAVITLGRAWQGHPAQAWLRDRWGRRHYIMVEPDEPDVVFHERTAVLLVGRKGRLFRAIENPHKSLVD